MNNGTKLLIGAVVIGTGAYIGWPILKAAFSKKEDQAPELNTDTVSNSPAEVILSKSSAITETYREKVIKLQKLLRVAADGIAGNQTMTRLNKYLKVATLTSSNIDGIIKILQVTVPAVDSLASFKNDTPANKAVKWNYWINQAKTVNITFDPYITHAYSLITGRSIYVDYANRAKTANNYNSGSIVEKLSGLI